VLLWKAACAKNNNHDPDSYHRYSEPKYITQNVLAYVESVRKMNFVELLRNSLQFCHPYIVWEIRDMAQNKE
jgi:hypothetical protein